MTQTYTPRAGTVAERAIRLLAKGPMFGADLAAGLGTYTANLDGNLRPALKAGLVLKEQFDGRSRWSLANVQPSAATPAPAATHDDDGKPIRRAVTRNTTQPTADALRAANPFGTRHRPASFEPLDDEAPCDKTFATCLVKFDQHAEPHSPPIDSSLHTRFGLFSDGVLVIEHEGQTISMDPRAASDLRTYLSRSLEA